MEELQTLIELVGKLPNLAVWFLVGYLAYKVAIVGSVYGVIRFAISAAREMYLAKINPAKTQLFLEGTLFDSSATKEEFLRQLSRLMYIGKNKDEYKSSSIHANWGLKHFREAIDLMEKMQTEKK